MKKFKLFLLYIFIFSGINIPAQISDSKTQKTLDQKVKENQEMLMTDSDKAFNQMDELIEQALSEENQEAELSLLSRKTWYYFRKTDLKEALKEAQKLESKAIKYKKTHWQTAAHGYKLEIYSLSDLYEEAIREFETTLKLLDQSDRPEDDINFSKAICYIKVAVVYERQKNFGTSKKMLIKADEYIAKIKNDERRREIRYMNFSNLGVANVELNNIDSAEYFINQSLMLSKKEDETSLTQFRNFAVMGQIYNKKKNYPLALDHLKSAEKLQSGLAISLLEQNALYEELSESYKAMDSLEQANIYAHKAKDIEIELEKSKNNSLHKIIKEDLLKEKNYSTPLLIGAGVLLFLSFIFIFRLYRRNKILAKQEKEEELYFTQNKPSILEEQKVYTQLIEMAKNDDKSFIIAFHDKFPEFYDKLIQINPKLVESEIEFCALLKLKLSTKEIAQVQNIEPKTVKNKKNRIRKRLNIPIEQELYYFFNQL